MVRAFPPALLCLLLIAGCSVGPDYDRPALAGSAGNWTEPADTGAIDPAWWRRFGDAELTALIERALAAAPDIREARARLAEARADRDAAGGGRLPRINASASVTENRQSIRGVLPVENIPGFPRDYSMFDLGFDASWELDLWGRQRREVEAADARLGAAEAAYRDVLVQLSAEIARAYIDLRAAQADQGALAETVEATADIARLTRLRFDAGEASRLDVENAEVKARAAAAAVPGVRAAAAAAAYRIAALVGSPPELAAMPLLTATGPQLRAPASILVGVRSDLLERRPDVRRAERALAAASAGIGLAKADLLPRISLLGAIGRQARQAEDIGDGGATRYQLGPSFSWPIFSGGVIRARVRAAGARAEAAAATYEKAVAGALADSAAAINRFLNAQEAARETAAADVRAHAAYVLSQQRESRGEDSRLQLLQARLNRIDTDRSAIAARRAEGEAAIALFKALGGAWQAVPEPEGAGTANATALAPSGDGR